MSKIVSVTLGSWGGGLNTENDEFALDSNEFSSCNNIDIGTRGEIKSRKGWTTYSSLAQPLETFDKWERINDDVWNIAIDTDGNVHYGTTAAMSSSFKFTTMSGGEREYPISHAVIDNRFFLTSLRDYGTPKVFDGTSWTSTVYNDFRSDESALDADIDAGDPLPTGRLPRARALLAVHDRLFAGNVLEGSTIKHNRLYYSGYAPSGELDPTLWPTLQYMDVGSDDGTEITALCEFGDSIAIFKDHSIYLLNGHSTNSFYLHKIVDNKGTVAAHTVQSWKGKLIWLDPSTGVWAFDSANIRQLDEKINVRLLSGLKAASSEIYKASSYIYRNKYYLSVPFTATGAWKTFVLDLITGAWTEYDYGVKDAMVFEDEVYGVGIVSDRYGLNSVEGVQTLHDGHKDGTLPVKSIVELSWLMPKELGDDMRLRKFITYWVPLTNYIKNKIAINVDFGSTSLISKELNEPAALGQSYNVNIPVPSKLIKSLKIFIESNPSVVTEYPWQLDKIALRLSGRSRPRGN